MTCKLCDQDKALIKAHIFPRKLYGPLTNGSDVPIVYPTNRNRRKQQWQSGIHDNEILCANCDGDIIGPFDHYAQELLLKDMKTYRIATRNNRQWYILQDIDYVKLKLFFISVLWRSSITKNPFFSDVNLGKWEDKLKNMINNKDPGNANDFSVILVKYEGDLSCIMPSPCMQRTSGDNINYYRFRMAGYLILIKVDKRAFPEELHAFILRANSTLRVLIADYEKSSEFIRVLEAEPKIPK